MTSLTQVFNQEGHCLTVTEIYNVGMFFWFVISALCAIVLALGICNSIGITTSVATHFNKYG